jgi:hypothetical protein
MESNKFEDAKKFVSDKVEDAKDAVKKKTDEVNEESEENENTKDSFMVKEYPSNMGPTGLPPRDES